MPINWDPSYETGHVDIDRQHRQLLELVDSLRPSQGAPTRHVILGVLDHVMDFTISHFLMEEDLMRQVDYPAPASEEMIRQHREFTSDARQRVLEFRSGELVSVLPLRTFLADWLKVHELGQDKLLADFIREQAKASPASGDLG